MFPDVLAARSSLLVVVVVVAACSYCGERGVVIAIHMNFDAFLLHTNIFLHYLDLTLQWPVLPRIRWQHQLWALRRILA